MKKGISLYFGFASPYPDRIKKIKEAGFNCVITNADPKFDKQNGTIEEQVKLFKKYGLKLSFLHMRYKSSDLHAFFEDSALGDTLEANLIEDIKIAAKYGFSCVLVHLESLTSDYSIGFSRLERVLLVCKELDIPLAIENLFDIDTFTATMKHFDKNPYVKMCYDSGHNHCFDPDNDYFEKFGDKIICLHLHDNMGGKIDIKKVRKSGVTDYSSFTADLHTLNKYGNIDWDALAKKLACLPHEVCLDYELLLHKRCDETEADVLKETFAQAVELENLINKYRVNG